MTSRKKINIFGMWRARYLPSLIALLYINCSDYGKHIHFLFHAELTMPYTFSISCRTDDAGSVYHKIWFNESSPQFKVDTNYYASAYIKLANMPSKEQYIKIRLFAKVVYAAGGT